MLGEGQVPGHHRKQATCAADLRAEGANLDSCQPTLFPGLEMPSSADTLAVSGLFILGAGNLLMGTFLWLAPRFQSGEHAVQAQRGENPALGALVGWLYGLFTTGYGLALVVLPKTFMHEFGLLIAALCLLAIGAILIVAATRFERLQAVRGQPRE